MTPQTDTHPWGSLRKPDEPPAFSHAEWIDRFERNSATSAEGSPHIVHRTRQPVDRGATSFPMVQRQK